MKKIHTRLKRKHGLSRGHNHYKYFHPGSNRVRPKTFESEEHAKTWAESHSLKGFEIVEVKRNRFKVMVNSIPLNNRSVNMIVQ